LLQEKYDVNWWIGRLIEKGSDFGFIPSIMKLEKLILADGLRRSRGSVAKTLLFKRQQTKTPSPYIIVPLMRPILLVGPSLKRFTVTDDIQNKLLDSLQLRFSGRYMLS